MKRGVSIKKGHKDSLIDKCFCGLSLREHPHCKGCGILFGQGHLVSGATRNGYCGGCVRDGEHLSSEEVKRRRDDG